MSRRCQCSRRCRHIARGSEALLPPERLAALESLEALLVDAADSYDSDGLQFDPACEVHGERPTSNAECCCRGDLTSALEFIHALFLDVRSAKANRYNAPAGNPNRTRADPRLLPITA